MGEKKAGSGGCLPKGERRDSDVGLGLAETLHAVSGLPLTTLFQEVNALEALEYVAFNDESGDSLEAFMLGHGSKWVVVDLLKGLVGTGRPSP